MIQRTYIIEYQEKAPWQTYEQVEQDMIIERALVDIFNNGDFYKLIH
jgi:hypothetical protein